MQDTECTNYDDGLNNIGFNSIPDVAKNWQEIGAKIIIHFVYSIELIKKKNNTFFRILFSFFPACYAKITKEIFSTIYKDTKQRLNVRSIRFLRDDVAVVHVEGSVVKKAEEFPTTPMVVPVFILTKDKGRWLIAVFQNTKTQQAQSANH